MILLKTILLSSLFLSTNHFNVVAPAAPSTMDPLPSSLDGSNHEVSSYFEYLTDNTESYYDDLVFEDLTTTSSQKVSTTEEEQAWTQKDSNNDIDVVNILKYCGIGSGTSVCIITLCCVIMYCRDKRNARNNVKIPPAPPIELLIHTTEHIQISNAYKDKKMEIIFYNREKAALAYDGYCRENIQLQVAPGLEKIFIAYLLEENEGYIVFELLKSIPIWDPKLLISHDKEYQTIQMPDANEKISLNKKEQAREEVIKSDLNKVREIFEEYIVFGAAYHAKPIQDSPDIKSKSLPPFTQPLYSFDDILYFINFKGKKDETIPYQEREARYRNYDDALKDGWEREGFLFIEDSLRVLFSKNDEFRCRLQEDKELQKILTQIMVYRTSYLPSTHLIDEGYRPILCHNKLIIF